MIFGTLPPIVVNTNADGLAAKFGFTITWPGTIDYPYDCRDLYDDPRHVLHEHYHLLHHWPMGMFPRLHCGARYATEAYRAYGVHDAMPAEGEAESFARRMAPEYDACRRQRCPPCRP
jgi:hypothetical protein